MILQNIDTRAKYNYINSLMNSDGKVFLLVENIATAQVLLLPYGTGKWVVVEKNS